MIFVTASATFSLDAFADWLNLPRDAEDPRAVIILQNLVIDQRVQITSQSNLGQFFLEADRLEDELLVARDMALYSGQSVHLYLIQDEAHLRIVSELENDGDVLATLDPPQFLSSSFTIIGRAQFEEPDDFIHDRLLDWATTWLHARGQKNHLGFASFDRHRLVIHAESQSAFRDLAETSAENLGQNGDSIGAIGIAHRGFSASLELMEPLKDGTKTYMGFVYFYDQPEWREMSSADKADQKLDLIALLCSRQTPWVASDIRNRSLDVAKDGGSWIDVFEWKNDSVQLRQEFFQAP